ncbi:threonine synthase [Ktedonospora formicarum]|uniref:Threonine synthase n=1 Tax=Ktedonospora formicarum TaxID=2778364 RepID=A0A8J3MUH9_9CHLR|nr:threonine synthase [Ktedonospora formicarum]GHO45425.1 threonine synthase [Ktedonospora formicarum]
MAINSTGLQPGREPGEGNMQSQATLAPEVAALLSAIKLRCVECSALYPPVEMRSSATSGMVPRYRCDCGGVLDVELEFALPKQIAGQGDAESWRLLERSSNASAAGALWRQVFDERVCSPPIWPISTDQLLLDYSGVWRYRELILPAPEPYVIARPEGNTNLYPVGMENCPTGRVGHRQIGTYAGLDLFFLKHEGENPSGSFKDRGMTVGVTMANLLGATAVACASTGNTSASLASYAAQAGMKGIVFLPAGNVASGKLAQTLAYGATTVQIKGDFDAAMSLVEQVCNELGIYLLNSLNPFRIEGQKAIAFEILQQLDWQAPDWLILPAGNLGNISAIGKAFRQAYDLCLITQMPRIAAIQAAGANPFYRSYRQQFARRESVKADTVATAIKIGNPVSYARARRIIEVTDGIVAEVTDAEILAAKAMIDRAGIGCEPASAATLAGAHKLVAEGVIKRDERVVGILTGNLLKDSVTGIPQQGSGIIVEANLDAVRKVLAV